MKQILLKDVNLGERFEMFGEEWIMVNDVANIVNGNYNYPHVNIKSGQLHYSSEGLIPVKVNRTSFGDLSQGQQFKHMGQIFTKCNAISNGQPYYLSDDDVVILIK